MHTATRRRELQKYRYTALDNLKVFDRLNPLPDLTVAHIHQKKVVNSARATIGIVPYRGSLSYWKLEKGWALATRKVSEDHSSQAERPEE